MAAPPIDRTVVGVKPRGPLRRRLFTFGQEPATVRSAIAVLVTATVITMVAGGFAVWMVDRKDFPHFSDALWWALQTVTTVGYGDVTPTTVPGRVVGALVLLYAIAFLTILTAAITTSFIERAKRARRFGQIDDLADIITHLEQITERLDVIEHRLRTQEDAGSTPST